MKSSKTAIFGRVFLFIIVLLLAGGFLLIWWKNATSPKSSDSTPVLFTITRGEDVRHIASRLAQENLISSPTGFFVLVKLMGIEKSLQAGEFHIAPSMDAATIAKSLMRGTFDSQVTTLEGWRDEEIATKLSNAFGIPEQEFLKYARQGYMFPDTYRIPKDATAAAIVQIFQDTFDKKVAPVRSDARKTGLAFSDVITLASIVEREGRTGTDRPVIAGILLKRLKADWPLQADATLQYILGYQPQEKSWWRKSLFDDDKKIVSPYNTYEHTGLPPGPIANPGLESIKAVIYPKATDYWYYLHDTEGRAHYAKTIEEHNANVAKYLQ